MSRRFKEAGAPTTSPGKLPPQRGDQGGRRAHDDYQPHSGTEQDAPVPDEIFQVPEMSLLQSSLWSVIIFLLLGLGLKKP